MQHYGYKVAVIDLRNPTRSDGYNLLTLINRYMDICREQPSNLAARAKAEKYAKILAKTIINPEGDAGNLRLGFLDHPLQLSDLIYLRVQFVNTHCVNLLIFEGLCCPLL